jgi:hypothetical protein
MYTDEKTKNINLVSYSLTLEKCDPDIHFKKYKEIFLSQASGVPLDQLYCINHNHINYDNSTFKEEFSPEFMNTYATQPSKFITIFIEDCSAPFSHKYGYYNSNKTCKNQNEIDEMLETFYVYVYHIDSYVDLSNYEEPNKYFINSYTQMLSNSIYKKNFITVKNTTIRTDIGFLMSDYKTIDFPQLSQYRNDMATGEQNLIFELNLETSIFTDFYDRKYIKVQDIMASTGGLFKFLSLIGLVLNYYFSKKIFYFSLARLFGIESNQNEICVKNESFNSIVTENTKSPINNVKRNMENNFIMGNNLNEIKTTSTRVKEITKRPVQLQKEKKTKNKIYQNLNLLSYLKSLFYKKLMYSRDMHENILKKVHSYLSLEFYMEKMVQLEINNNKNKTSNIKYEKKFSKESETAKAIT